MATIGYKLEGSDYVLLKDDKPLKTPDGVVVTANSEELATRLVDALKKRQGYTLPTSILTYHYTYCNLKAQWDIEFIANDFSNCVSSDSLLNDDYLMFRQSSPIKPAIASFFEKELPERFHKYNLNQLTAVLVIHTAYYSWLLSHYIITDIIEPLKDDKDADLKALKEEFLADLKEYDGKELGYHTDTESYTRHLDEISHAIDAFVDFFLLDNSK